jgi:hypothetical protein
MRATAMTMGVIGLTFIVIGAIIALNSDQGVSTPSSGILIRTGAVLGAVALVIPSFRKPSPFTLIIAAAGLILVLARPGLIWVALVGWLIWLVPGRQRSTVSKDS